MQVTLRKISRIMKSNGLGMQAYIYAGTSVVVEDDDGDAGRSEVLGAVHCTHPTAGVGASKVL